jgi:poly-gamma-glutamate system protein
MKKREGKISILSLLIATGITILLMIIELNSKTRVEAKYYDEKLQAAETAQKALAAIKDTVTAMGIPIDRINDPNATGVIGVQYSPMTTERGDLDEKLTSTNPNFAALVVELLHNAGIRKGDRVAVSLSGSYPALNVAVLSALQTLELRPVITTSVASSMWGANYPQLTYLDMEAILNEKGIIESRTNAASLGGEDDIGRGLSPAGREIIEQTALRNEVPLLDATTLEGIIEQKMAIYNSTDAIECFINAGEKTTALAGTESGIGMISPHTVRGGNGLIARFSRMGVPVINLMEINALAQEYSLPVAPIPLPEPGDGRLYYEYKYSVTFAIIATIILAFVLFIMLRFEIDYYLKRRVK